MSLSPKLTIVPRFRNFYSYATRCFCPGRTLLSWIWIRSYNSLPKIHKREIINRSHRKWRKRQYNINMEPGMRLVLKWIFFFTAIMTLTKINFLLRSYCQWTNNLSIIWLSHAAILVLWGFLIHGNLCSVIQICLHRDADGWIQMLFNWWHWWQFRSCYFSVTNDHENDSHGRLKVTFQSLTTTKMILMVVTKWCE